MQKTEQQIREQLWSQPKKLSLTERTQLEKLISEGIDPELTEDEQNQILGGIYQEAFKEGKKELEDLKCYAEVHKAIRFSEARENKGERLKHRAYSVQNFGEREFPIFSTKEFADLIFSIGVARSIERRWESPFELDPLNRSVFQTLALYFNKDQRFVNQSPGYNFNKGILLVGPVGCGKTEMMKLFSDNPLLSYTVHSTRETVDAYCTYGATVISQSKQGNVNKNRDRYFGQEVLAKCYDDLGAEKPGNHMGNFRNVMADIMAVRYNYCPAFATHATSNYNLDQLSEKYDERDVDRMRAMFNVLEYPAGSVSRRK